MNKSVALTVALVIIFVVTRYGPSDSLPLSVLLAGQTIAYLAMIGLFALLPRLVFEDQLPIFWSLTLVGAAASFLFSDSSFRADAVASWTALIAASLLIGRARLVDQKIESIALLGGIAVIGASLIWLLPNLQVMTALQKEQLGLLQSSWQTTLGTTLTVPAEREALTEQLTLLSAFLIRMIPSMIVLSWLTQFSIGLFLFLRATELIGMRRPVQPLSNWHMPFWLIGALIPLAIARLLGGEEVTYWADNGLAVLAVIYAVGGLAIGEFFMRRFGFGWFMKTAVYLMMFLSGLVGFLLLVGFGFFDSFMDWRSRADRGNELANEND